MPSCVDASDFRRNGPIQVGRNPRYDTSGYVDIGDKWRLSLVSSDYCRGEEEEVWADHGGDNSCGLEDAARLCSSSHGVNQPVSFPIALRARSVEGGGIGRNQRHAKIGQTKVGESGGMSFLESP